MTDWLNGRSVVLSDGNPRVTVSWGEEPETITISWFDGEAMVDFSIPRFVWERAT